VAENNRFRVMIEPLLLVATVVIAHRLAVRVGRRRPERDRRKEPGTSPDSTSPEIGS
jgi:hypothetical protein